MMDQSGGVLPRNRLAENKLPHGRDDGHRRRRWHAGACSRRSRSTSAGSSSQGISINFGSYFSETQARVAGARDVGARADRRRAGAHARHHGHGDARRRDGHDDGADLSAEQLRHDRRAGRGRARRRRRTVASTRATFAARARKSWSAVSEAIAHRRASRHARRGLPPQGRRISPAWGMLMDSCARRWKRRARAAWTSPRTCTSTLPAAPDSRRRSRAGRTRAAPTRCKKRLADPAIRARLKHELKTGSPGWWNIIEAAGGWDGVVLVNARNPAEREVRRQDASRRSRRRRGRIPPTRRGTSSRRAADA